MKTINDFINIFEKYVQKKYADAVIVLNTSEKVCQFKAFKDINLTLYYVNRKTSIKRELISVGNTAKILKDEDRDKVLKELEEELIFKIFDFIQERL